MNSNKQYLAVDLGASLVRVAIFDEKLNILRVSEAHTRDSIQGKADPNFSRTITAIENILQDQKVEVTAGCIGIPEYVSPSGDLTSNEQIDWTEQPRELLSNRFGFPWLVESDVRCAARAEARNQQDFLYVTLSSGISHCMVVDGKPLVGANGRAIGLGTMRAKTGEWTVEEVASGLGLARRYQEKSGQIRTTTEIMNRYQSDEIAHSLIENAVSEFSFALHHAAMLFDPARIVVGGGFWFGSELIRELTREKFADLMSGNICPQIEDATSKNGALIGAGAFAVDFHP